ncbi:tetratricopeptide repeat protein [Enterobacter sp.]|uniref:tetratricopeptide repeat protein n=1 Tax=Enterobacter sp. TaxID=42895 RepID=UPI00296F77A8|nr:tetratricopeptide repeat protein [Enterobacter sp.]
MVTSTPLLDNCSLSDLIFLKVNKGDSSNPEKVADDLLREARYEQALSSYLQLDPTDPRLATKIAYCEWMLDQYEEARQRLIVRIETLDGDGIALLSKLISIDRDFWKRDGDDEALIWPRLKTVTSASTVPLMAVFARIQGRWTADIRDPAQKLYDLSRLLTFYPDCQPLRIAVFESMQRMRVSAEEQYALLHAHSSSPLIPKFMWLQASAAAEVGRFDEALGYLTQLESNEHLADQPSQEVLWEIEIARCAIHAKTNPLEPASGFIRLGNDASCSFEGRVIAHRSALAVACESAAHLIPELADSFLNTLESIKNDIIISSTGLMNPLSPFTGNRWGGYVTSWSCGDLTPYKQLLIDTTKGRSNRLFCALFVIETLESDFLYTDTDELSAEFWDNLARDLGDVTEYPDEFKGELLSLYTVIHAHRVRPNWAKLGQYWMISAQVAQEHEAELPHHALIIEVIDKQAEFARKFATGVIKYLKNHAISSPNAFDLVEELAQSLTRHRLYKELYQLMVIVAKDDERSDAQFYLGLSSQNMKQKNEAVSAYQHVLTKNPEHYSALFNVLLLCTDHSDTPLLQQIEPYILNFSGDAEQEEELSEAWISAQKRCEDKNAAKTHIITRYLSTFPPLLEDIVRPEDISLRSAVALMALYRCTHAEPHDTDLYSLDESSLSFSPDIPNRAILFDLLQSGLASIHPATPADAFPVSDGKVSGIRFGSVRWHMSASCEALIKQLRALNGDLPERWHKELIPFAREIAQGEIMEYLGFLAEERRWPEPRNTETLSDLTRELINELSVAQAFNLAYLGAMSASDYKQKYRVNAKQATDMLIRRTGDRLESVRSGRYQAKPYDRPWKLPRSAVSIVLWGTLLNRGDDGFTQRMSDIKLEFLSK